jgi:drug/metabolite transporter (DMT)-like permease
MSAMVNRVPLGIACALIAAAFYGLVPNFARGAYLEGIPAVETTFFRTTIITLAFLLIAVAQKERFAVPRAAWPSLLLQALATLIVSVTYLASIQFIPVGLAVIIFFTFPVLIMLLSPVIEGHFPKVWQIAIAVAAFAGLVIAIGPSFNQLDLRGVGLAVLSSLGAVLQFFTGRTISRHLKPAVFGCLIHAMIWPLTLLIALYAGSGTLQMLPGGTATGAGLLFLWGVAVVYVIAYMLHMLSLRFAPASRVAPFYNLEPVGTTVCAALLFGERLSLDQYAGGGIVLAALVVSGIIGSRESKA